VAIVTGVEIELRHLRRLLAIAEAGGVAGAAAALEVSEQALAVQVARIEANVGGPLFVRCGDVMTPTGRGRQVLDVARVVLVEMTQLVAECRRAGTMRLSVVGPEVLVGPVAAGFAAKRADVAVSIRVTDAHTAVEAVSSGTADVAVTVLWPGSRAAAGLHSHEVDRVPVHVLLPDTHPLAVRGVLDLPDLADETWCFLADAAHAGAMVADCARHGFEPRVGYHVDTEEAVVEMVASGRAVALVTGPTHTRAGVVALPYRDPAQGELVVVWRPDRIPPDVERDLVAAVEGWHAARAWAHPAAVEEGLPGSVARPLRIGSVAELSAIPTVPRLRTVHGLYAEIGFGTQRELLDAACRGDLDMVLCQTLSAWDDGVPPGWPRRAVVCDEPVTVVLGTGHRLATGRVRLASLADEAWAVRSASGETELLRALGATAGFEPRIASSYTDPRQILAAVASGRLIRIADPATAEEGTVRRTVDDPVARRTLALVWSPDGAAAPYADVVAEQLRLSRSPYIAPDPVEWQ
jgi:DNA-binding transcriptional LysR family regulator